jgi:serine/threonine protein kinase
MFVFIWWVQVADFGLSKEEVYDGRKSVLKGTYGYMDPDYMSTNKFTKKSDVYSFGIILFELMTGINPQQGLMEYINLVSHFNTILTVQLKSRCYLSKVLIYKIEFCYAVYNQCESFICLDLMVKNKEVPIERYFKWWTSTKLVWIRYQNY